MAQKSNKECLEELKKQVTKIEYAVFGHENHNIPGLIELVQRAIEENRKEHDSFKRIIWYLGGCLFAISFLVTLKKLGIIEIGGIPI